MSSFKKMIIIFRAYDYVYYSLCWFMLYLKVFIKILFTHQCITKDRIVITEKEENEKIERNHVPEESEVLRKKRDVLTNKTKIILEKWFEENISHPYASKVTLFQLSLKTGVAEYKLQRWIEYKRTVTSEKKNGKPYVYFSIEDKKILRNFFDNQCKHPGPGDLTFLSKILEKDEKKIRTWFTNQRFKLKLK